MTVEEVTLPGTPGPLLDRVWGDLTAQERTLLKAHLLGNTSAEWLAFTLRDFGYTISASTIRTFRRSLKEV